MIKKLFFIIFIIIFNIYTIYDVNVIGFIAYNDGLGRLPISFIDCLKHDLKLNFIGHKDLQNKDIPKQVLDIINTSKKSRKAKISIYFGILDYFNYYKFYTKDSFKIAFSMFESTKIPQNWVFILNNDFDLVLVPDEYFVDVYKNSGVKIPIKVLPLILYLEDFLKQKPKEKVNEIFTFGVSGSLYDKRKNFNLLVDAFVKQFANNPKAKLKIHSRANTQNKNEVIELEEKLKKLNISNIEFILKDLSQSEYIDFIKSLDCYILLSRGEGFSNTPREAMALGIPVILSDNTSHKTICKTGLVKAVKSEILLPASYNKYQEDLGFQFDCEIEDVCKGMLDIYQNYYYYLENAKQGREWIKQYLKKNLKEKYLKFLT